MVDSIEKPLSVQATDIVHLQIWTLPDQICLVRYCETLQAER